MLNNVVAIKIKSLSVDKQTEKTLERNYLYKDIFFDLVNGYSYNSQLNKKDNINDIQGLFDIESVKNSIVNHFLTAPGQKILNPEFGIDLRRFLFDPVDDFTSDIIQDEIENKLPESEPRIEIKNVSVVADEDLQQYNIELEVDIPALAAYGVSIKSELKSIGYTIL